MSILILYKRKLRETSLRQVTMAFSGLSGEVYIQDNAAIDKL